MPRSGERTVKRKLPGDRMNPLLLLPPELAHRVALGALRLGLGPRQHLDDPRLAGELFGKPLRNPIGLSAGAEKQGEALVGWTRMGFGLVEAGTVTVQSRSGNPTPRIWRVAGHSVVNWMGLPGAGLAPFVANLRNFAEHPLRAQLMLGASIASPEGRLEEFTQLARECAPWVDYLTLNASCPNVAHCAGDPAETARQQLAAAREGAGDVPLMLKLGPTRDAQILQQMVLGAVDAGATGIITTNTVPPAERSLIEPVDFVWPTREGQAVGGYSGPALLDIADWMVRQCRQLLGENAPIIGVGGVQSGADAKRLLDAGANAIQLYTGLIYRGPGLVREIASTLLQGR